MLVVMIQGCEVSTENMSNNSRVEKYQSGRTLLTSKHVAQPLRGDKRELAGHGEANRQTSVSNITCIFI